MHVRVDPRPSPGMQHAVRVIILVLHHDTKKTKELVYSLDLDSSMADRDRPFLNRLD